MTEPQEQATLLINAALERSNTKKMMNLTQLKAFKELLRETYLMGYYQGKRER